MATSRLEIIWLSCAAGAATAPRALCLYASDAEIFDFRPGRFKTEEKLSGESEWARLEQAFAAIGKTARMMRAFRRCCRLLTCPARAGSCRWKAPPARCR